MHTKAVLTFLGLTFGVGYAVQIALLYLGLIVQQPTILHSIILAALVCIPGACAVVTGQLFPDDRVPSSRVWPWPAKGAAAIIGLVPVIFLGSYLIAYAAGWAQVDFGMGEALVQIRRQLNQPLPASVEAMLPTLVLVGGIVLGILSGATVYTAVAVCNEYGWRAYLLPRLLHLGRFRAHLIVGLFWSLWFLPLVIWWYGRLNQTDEFAEFLVRLVLFGIAFNFLIGEIWRRTHHLGLTALLVGSFVGNQEAVWDTLFVDAFQPSRTLQWTGAFGLSSILLWALVSAVYFFRSKGGEAPAAAPEGADTSA